jgi:hypothetical protein
MAQKKKRKKLSQEEIFLKAFKKANREIEMERNDGKWVATHRVWKNKKAYNRKRDRKCDTDYLFYCLYNSLRTTNHPFCQ